VIGAYRVVKRRLFGLQIRKKNHPVSHQLTELWLIKVDQLFWKFTVLVTFVAILFLTFNDSFIIA